MTPNEAAIRRQLEQALEVVDRGIEDKSISNAMFHGLAFIKRRLEQAISYCGAPVLDTPQAERGEE